MVISIRVQFVLFFLVLVALISCNRETEYNGNTPQIAASVDTLTFDTVFTAVGSATRSFKIYNREPGAIEVDVMLDKGTSSSFRLNVDGVAGATRSGVRINGGDSIYVFADVTVDPDKPLSVSPFVLEEQITITSGNSKKTVLATAWGQNANYIPGVKKKGIVSLLSCNLATETWDDPRPYVIYGLLLIDSCTLRLPKGTDIYVHGGVVTNDQGAYSDGGIFVGKHGKLIAEGSIDDPITMQGDRLEDTYDNRPGQWVGLRFLTGSRGNLIRNTTIKNSIIGVRVDSVAQLTIDKSKLHNISTSAVIGYQADIDIVNTLIYSTGRNAVQGVFGGNYSIKNSTLYNGGNKYSAIYGDNLFCFNQKDCENTTKVHPLRMHVENTIAIGEKNEIAIINYEKGGGIVDFSMNNNYIDLDTTESVGKYVWSKQNNRILRSKKDTIFLGKSSADFRPDTMSILINKGLANGINDDIDGKARDHRPDIGCYEF